MNYLKLPATAEDPSEIAAGKEMIPCVNELAKDLTIIGGGLVYREGKRSQPQGFRLERVIATTLGFTHELVVRDRGPRA